MCRPRGESSVCPRRNTYTETACGLCVGIPSRSTTRLQGQAGDQADGPPSGDPRVYTRVRDPIAARVGHTYTISRDSDAW